MFYLRSKTIPESYDPFLYGWTADKDLAERFKESRNMDRFRLVKKKMDDEECDILSKRYSTSMISMQPLTDGEQDIMVPMTWSEFHDVNAAVDAIDRMALENYSWINTSYLKPEIKEKLKELNTIVVHSNDELYSGINTIKIFIEKYRDIL